MPETCRQCGARLAPEQTCEDVFYLGQIKEVEDPAYYAVHHLSVPCYMLQHNFYSRQGWLEVYGLLAEFVNGLTPGEARRRNRESMDSGKRTFSITRGAKLDGVEQMKWSFTVADVRLDSAEYYCADVRRWAECVLADSAELVRAVQADAPETQPAERKRRK